MKTFGENFASCQAGISSFYTEVIVQKIAATNVYIQNFNSSKDFENWCYTLQQKLYKIGITSHIWEYIIKLNLYYSVFHIFWENNI